MTAAVITVDSGAVKQPAELRWDDREPIDYAHGGKPIYSARRSLTLSFPTMTQAQYANWQGFDNGSTHSIYIDAPTLNGGATYTGVYIRANGGLTIGSIVVGATATVWNINV